MLCGSQGGDRQVLGGGRWVQAIVPVETCLRGPCGSSRWWVSLRAWDVLTPLQWRLSWTTVQHPQAL